MAVREAERACRAGVTRILAVAGVLRRFCACPALVCLTLPNIRCTCLVLEEEGKTEQIQDSSGVVPKPESPSSVHVLVGQRETKQ